jgi:hypothetical protein
LSPIPLFDVLSEGTCYFFRNTGDVFVTAETDAETGRQPMETYMETSHKNIRQYLTAALATAVVLIAGCSGMGMHDGMGSTVMLTGGQEVPPVSTAATAKSTVRVASDKSVSGSITTTGIVSTAAHIHIAAAGVNGPVIVPLTKTADNEFRVPSGALLTDEQYAAYRAGNLYVNVHSAAYPGGEIRAQLSPN